MTKKGDLAFLSEIDDRVYTLYSYICNSITVLVYCRSIFMLLLQVHVFRLPVSTQPSFAKTIINGP